MSLGKLEKLQKRYAAAKKKQDAVLSKMREDEKNLKKELEAEQAAFLTKTIKQTGFPIDNPAVLIGAILEAKEKMKDPEVINLYIDRYTAFAKEKGIEPAAETGEDVTVNGGGE